MNDYIHNPIRQILLHPSNVWHQFGSRDISEDHEWDHIWHQGCRLLLRRHTPSFSDNRRAHCPTEPGQEETSRRRSTVEQWQEWISQESDSFLGTLSSARMVWNLTRHRLKLSSKCHSRRTWVSRNGTWEWWITCAVTCPICLQCWSPWTSCWRRKPHGSGFLRKPKRSPASRHCWLQRRLWPTLTPLSQPL